MDEHYDVVVVGTGNAALCSAISAKEYGAKVLVVEKAPENKKGGNSFFTDGAIRFSYGDFDGIKKVVPGIVDEKIHMPFYTEEDYYNDLMDITNNKSDKSLAYHLTSHSYSTILWLKEQGVEFELNENQCFENNGILEFWGGLPVKTKQKGIGLIQALLDRAHKSEIDIRYQTKAIRLEKSNNKIIGIYVESKNKEIKKVQTKSVILACGGFEANKQKRIEYLGPEWKNAIVRGTEYNTGDGIEMALEVGANKKGQYNGCHAHTTDYNAPKVGDFKKPGDIYKKSSYPLGLIVNIDGKRFVDEGADFRNYTYAKYGKETLNQTQQKAFQIYDNQVASMLRKEYSLEEATMIQADSLSDLAEKMEINKKGFLKIIEKYNNSVQAGKYNPSIKDGKGTKNLTPPKSNWALQFKQPPFYAYPVTCGITFTFGGIEVNKKGEVLGNNSSPIAGLYAAGEMIGGLFYHNYPGGSGLMSGSVFGRTAGKNAGKYVTSTLTN